MGVFEFIIILVLISTAGKVMSDRAGRRDLRERPPQLGPGEVEGLREAVDDLSGRLHRLEQERDFYKELLEAPGRRRGLPSETDQEDSR